MLQKLPTVSVQRLFGLAVFLKILFVSLGYVLGSAFWLGMVIPLSVMVLYMVVGYYKREDDVSEDKFADSCYYIGFIFTIVSIIMCLIDVPKMAPGKGMYEIAIRFGTAMVSTVLGMIVRVYLVSFKKDAADAIKDVEAILIESTRAFTLQLQDTVKNLQVFEAQVMDAAKVSVAGVQVQVEALGRNFSESLDEFYEQVNVRHHHAFEAMLGEVKGASANLADSVEVYSHGMKGHLESIELKVTQFSDAVTARLRNTAFPDDFFARQLQSPMEQLKLETANLGESVRGVSEQVGASSSTLGQVLNTIHTKTKKTQVNMDAVVDLSEQHRSIMNNADIQLGALGSLTQRLQDLEAALKGSLQAVNNNSMASSDLLGKVAAVATSTDDLRSEIKGTVAALTSNMDANVMLTNGVIQKLESQTAALSAGANTVIVSIEKSTDIAGQVAQQMSESVSELRTFAGAAAEAASGMRDAAGKAGEAAEGASAAAKRTLDAVQCVKELDVSIRQQTGDLLDAAQTLRLSGDAQSTAIADAVVRSISSLPTQAHLTASPKIDSLFPSRMSEDAPAPAANQVLAR